MQIGLLLPAALLFPLVWGWATYVVVSRLWPRQESTWSPETGDVGVSGAERSARRGSEVDPMTHNFQI